MAYGLLLVLERHVFDWCLRFVIKVLACVAALMMRSEYATPLLNSDVEVEVKE